MREGEYARLDARELEKVADHTAEAFDLGPDLGVVAPGVGDDAVLQGLGHRPETGERGAQVVGDPRDQLAPGGFEGTLALPGGGQPGAGGRQFPAQLGQLGGRRPARRGEASTVTEGAGRRGEGPAAGDNAAAQQQRHRERDDGGHGADRRHDPQVVRGEKHRPGNGQGPGEHRADGDHRDDRERHRQRTLPEQPERERAQQSGGRGAESGVRGDEQYVTHRVPPVARRSGSRLPIRC
jgi:hypothetical protein